MKERKETFKNISLFASAIATSNDEAKAHLFSPPPPSSPVCQMQRYEPNLTRLTIPRQPRQPRQARQARQAKLARQD